MCVLRNWGPWMFGVTLLSGAISSHSTSRRKGREAPSGVYSVTRTRLPAPAFRLSAHMFSMSCQVPPPSSCRQFCRDKSKVCEKLMSGHRSRPGAHGECRKTENDWSRL